MRGNWVTTPAFPGKLEIQHMGAGNEAHSNSGADRLARKIGGHVMTQEQTYDACAKHDQAGPATMMPSIAWDEVCGTYR